MSTEQTAALTGAVESQVAPVSTEQVAAEQVAQESTTAETVEQREQRTRDEKGRFQSRINEITARAGRAERALAEREARLAELEARLNQQAAPVSDKPPVPADFNYDLDAWGAAVAAHAVKQAEARAETKFSERQQQTTQQQVYEQYAERERAYAATDPDYPEALDSLRSSVRFHPTTLEVIAASEHGPAVVKHLGTHLDVADRIARMPAHLAAAEIARIEAVVKAPKPKPVTQAPAPAPQVGGGAAVQKDPERMTTDEWVAWRRDQLKKR
jgi:DNA repair exonuclease SbcCD ATPase subunit